MCFIPLHKVRKHKEFNVSISQVELKLTDFTKVGAYTLPTHGAWGVCVAILKCVWATSSLKTTVCFRDLAKLNLPMVVQF
jgi:hypothetical protein